jgi:hypothetical protein
VRRDEHSNARAEPPTMTTTTTNSNKDNKAMRRR